MWWRWMPVSGLKNEKTNKLIKYFNSVVADKIWLYHCILTLVILNLSN